MAETLRSPLSCREWQNRPYVQDFCHNGAMLNRVAAIAVPGLSIFELSVACEIFGIDRTDTGGPTFDFTVCTPVPGVVPVKSGGMDIVVDNGLEATYDADAVIMAAYSVDYGPVAPEVLEALRAAHARGAWVVGVCSGSFALAEAGLLDGKRCTTHWMYTDRLAAAAPNAQVSEDALYVEDDRIITSAGTAAGIDACLYLVRCELGPTAAAQIARRMVVPPHRDGGQAQYIESPLPTAADSLSGLLTWMVEHLTEDLTVPELASRAFMSERTFARRFRAETGTTPAAWLARQRLLRAQELLENTSISVDEVAEQSGFGTAAVLRHHFSRSLGTTPLAYRRRFRGRELPRDAAMAAN